MKTITKKIISLILTAAVLAAASLNCFAVDEEPSTQETPPTREEHINVESVQIYTNLSASTSTYEQLEFRVYPSDAEYAAVEWKSLNEKVATVSPDGKVSTTGRIGSADIVLTVTNYDGTTVTGTVDVSVEPDNPFLYMIEVIIDMFILFIMYGPQVFSSEFWTDGPGLYI